MNYGIGNVKAKSKSLFTTTTAPTESGDVITLATTDIVESGFKVGDYLAYVDNGNISALYSISAISSGTATLSLVGAFGGGGGKQLYQHYIHLEGDLGPGKISYINLTIINDTNTAFTKSSLITWCANNLSANYTILTSGVEYVGSYTYLIFNIYYDNGVKGVYFNMQNYSTNAGLNINFNDYSIIDDNVIGL